MAVALVYEKSSASVSPLLVTPSDKVANLASTLSVMAAKSSNSSFLAAVDVVYSSATALHKAIESSQILLFLSILV